MSRAAQVWAVLLLYLVKNCPQLPPFESVPNKRYSSEPTGDSGLPYVATLGSSILDLLSLGIHLTEDVSLPLVMLNI